jgi:hypothetical protein
MWANACLFIGSIEEYSGCLEDGAVVILGFNSWNLQHSRPLILT